MLRPIFGHRDRDSDKDSGRTRYKLRSTQSATSTPVNPKRNKGKDVLKRTRAKSESATARRLIFMLVLIGFEVWG